MDLPSFLQKTRLTMTLRSPHQKSCWTAGRLLEGRLPDEPLDPGLLGEGIEADGIEGVVGVLADGQPISSGKASPTMTKCLILALFM
jgi:hypothetical protein